jgi:hypothetical protein
VLVEPDRTGEPGKRQEQLDVRLSALRRRRKASRRNKVAPWARPCEMRIENGRVS